MRIKTNSLATISAAFAVTCLVSSAPAGQLSVEFSGGVREVTLAWGETVQLDLIWTMNVTDRAGTLLSGVNLRFNVNDLPDPDGTDRNDAFVVDSVATPVPAWSTEAASGVGSFFSEFGLFLSAIHPDAVIGVEADGTEFRTVIASFVLRQAGSFAGDTYITLRHNGPNDILPDATQDILDGVGNFEWDFRWQEEVNGKVQFNLGLGNPGDTGPQWEYHGFETFQPLIIHSDGSGPPPRSEDISGEMDAPVTEDPQIEDGADPPEPSNPNTPAPRPEDPTQPPDDGGNDPVQVNEPPDRDLDGVAKNRDMCPSTPRGKAVDNNGCSIDDPLRPQFDKDRDGVADKDDDCPRTFFGHSVDAKGCAHAQRDDDRDGVKNGNDLCDGTPPGEEINFRGCPASRLDEDADSVSDADDLCPDTASSQSVDSAGCAAGQEPSVIQESDASGQNLPAPQATNRAASVGCGAVGLIPLVGLMAGLLGLRAGRRGATVIA